MQYVSSNVVSYKTLRLGIAEIDSYNMLFYLSLIHISEPTRPY